LAHDHGRHITPRLKPNFRQRDAQFSSRSPAQRKLRPHIEEAIFAGVPVKLTLLFSREHYVAGPERTCAASSGDRSWLNPQVGSVPRFRQPLGRRRDGQVPRS